MGTSSSLANFTIVNSAIIDFSSGIRASGKTESTGQRPGEERVVIPSLVRKRKKTYGAQKFLIPGLRMKMQQRRCTTLKLPPMAAPSSGSLLRRRETETDYEA